MVMYIKKWFTLIEVLIAIGVFSVGVIAVLNLVVHNLSTLDRTEVKTISTLLAKEWIALAFHVRDANLAKELPWNCVFSNAMYSQDANFDFHTQVSDTLEQVVCNWYFWSWEVMAYQLQLDPADYYTIEKLPYEDDFEKRFQQHRLYLYTETTHDIRWYWYQQDQLSWVASFFSRYITFSPLKEDQQTLPSDKVLKVTSHVLFKKWGLTWEVVLESIIGQH